MRAGALALGLAVFWQLAPVSAQEVLTEAAVTTTESIATEEGRGPVTNLPMPRYVSLKTGEANVRRGPSLSHRIDWIFTRRDMPLQIVAEYGHWRRVIDRDGMGGWVHYSMLSGSRTVIVDEDMLQIHTRPGDEMPVTAILQAGVIADLGSCEPDWCRIEAGGYKGWAPKAALWGVDSGELRE